MKFDPGGKLAGRGAYLHRTRACVEEALRKHHLERALRQPLPDDTAKAVAALASEAPIGPPIPDIPSDGTTRPAGGPQNNGLDNRSFNG